MIPCPMSSLSSTFITSSYFFRQTTITLSQESSTTLLIKHRGFLCLVPSSSVSSLSTVCSVSSLYCLVLLLLHCIIIINLSCKFYKWHTPLIKIPVYPYQLSSHVSQQFLLPQRTDRTACLFHCIECALQPVLLVLDTCTKSEFTSPVSLVSTSWVFCSNVSLMIFRYSKWKTLYLPHLHIFNFLRLYLLNLQFNLLQSIQSARRSCHVN